MRREARPSPSFGGTFELDFFSSDFAARGYAGASHGRVNVRDYSGIQSLFGQVSTGDKVVVYRS